MEEDLLNYFNGDELAANVWQSKYAAEGETTPDQMHRRMAKEFARIEKKYQGVNELSIQLNRRNDLSEYGRHRQELDEVSIYKLFENFKYIIPQGSVMATLGTNQIASLSNCWVIESPLDSYASIHKADGDLIYYYKRRGGVGVDISNLRPANTETNNAAKSTTGAVSFMHRFSNTTREVAMNGRRGALMISIDINHPDVMDFIKIKRDGTSVTGANISIKLNNDFMKAVENDEDYILRFPCESNIGVGLQNAFSDNYNELVQRGTYYTKRIKAREYWDEIVKSARDYAEPGLMYWDNVIDNDPAAVYPQYKPITSNPCGEQFLNANDSCRLMVLNLFSFVKNPFTEFAHIDYEELYKISYEHCRLGDDLVDLELEYIQRIIDKIKSDPEPDNVKRSELELWENSYKNTKAGRRVGLGITALADMLAALNLKYDSGQALEVIDLVMNVKMRAELDCTIDLAILRGTFEGWDKEVEFPSSKDDNKLYGNNFYHNLQVTFPVQVERMKKFGRRNVSISTIAPTGSVSLLAGNCTSGCEPLFQPFYMRRKKINPGEAGVRVDFVDEVGDSWQEFPVLHPKFKEWLEINDSFTGYSDAIQEGTLDKDWLKDCFESSPWYKSTANDIDWKRRVEIQSILQRYTTNAISSTINLPSTVSYQEVSDIYMHGWKKGLKGQTIYVDGSRSGVLVTETSKSRDSFEYIDAVKRPRELHCKTHVTTLNGEKYNVFVGLMDGKPYEIFVTNYFTKEDDLIIKKIKKGRYDLIKNGETYSEDITTEMSDEQEAVTRLVSTSLRHGADIKFIVEQLNKTSEGNMFGFTRGLARVLKKYIPDGAKSTVLCNDCGSSNVIFEEGCNKCLDCGSSKCS